MGSFTYAEGVQRRADRSMQTVTAPAMINEDHLDALDAAVAAARDLDAEVTGISVSSRIADVTFTLTGSGAKLEDIQRVLAGLPIVYKRPSTKKHDE